MAVVEYISYKSQSYACMSEVMNYVSKEEKVLDDGIKMLAGKDCMPENAFTEFTTTKEQFNKMNGTYFYHFMQSFHPEEEITPFEVQQAGLKLAQYFEGYEVLVATHVDREHKHNHLIVNSVSFETGKKFQGGPNTLENLRRLSDMICKEMGFSILPPYEQNPKTKGVGLKESRVAQKGESWKFKLMNVIDTAMANTQTKIEFIDYMRKLGYEVKWTEERKYITYTVPSGEKVRDNKLHYEEYLKENMEGYYAKQRRTKKTQSSRRNSDETICSHDIRNTAGAMGSYGDYADADNQAAEGADRLSKGAADRREHGGKVKILGKLSGGVAEGKYNRENQGFREDNRTEGNSSSSNRGYNKQDKNRNYAENRIPRPQNIPLDNTFSKLACNADGVIQALTENNDLIAQSYTNVDLGSLSGDELFEALRNLKDTEKHLKAYNELLIQQDKECQNFDITMTIIEEYLEERLREEKYGEEEPEL